jgi:uncharacterized protein YbaR (Trm112 family)
MSRLAPTLFIGLGGSGIQVLRWIKTRILQDQARSGVQEPVAFLGIDFDAMSNAESRGIETLGALEFRYFDPSPIAAAVNNLDRERTTPASMSRNENPDSSRWEFSEIREWYPDPEQSVIRYAQSEATGAAQWRPLGRIGFFLYDREIYSLLSDSLTELDRKRSQATQIGDQPMVIIVSSISGGTGSSMLFDVAVALRKIRRGISVRSYLILPEVFEHIEFRDRIFANAYGTLWEIANLKNQHVIFQARYPRVPEVTAADSPPPFQRVYLLGPWAGDRRPFIEPREAYPQFGDVLRLTITREIRAAALTAEANASADAGAPLNSQSSRDIFCTSSAMGMRLIDYKELTDSTIRQMLTEIVSNDDERELLQTLSPVVAGDRVNTLSEWVTKQLNVEDPQYDVTREKLIEQIRSYFGHQLASKTTSWKASDMQRIVHELRVMLGHDSFAPNHQPPGIVASLRQSVRDRLTKQLVGEEMNDYRLSPRAYEAVLQQLSASLEREPLRRRDLPYVEYLEGLEQWISGILPPASLAQSLTPQHLLVVRDAVIHWVKTVPSADDLQTWRKLAVIAGAREAVSKLLEEETSKWSSIVELQRKFNTLVGPLAENERDETLLLDGRQSPARRALAFELARVSPDRAKRFRDAMLASFNHFYEDFRANPLLGDRLLEQWRERMHTLFESELGIVDRREDRDARGSRYSLVAPEALFTDEQIKLAILRCATRVFLPGRVQSRATVRLARLLVPGGFHHRRQFHDKLRGWCRAMLGAAGSSLPDDPGNIEKRVVVVLEDLFHPAEDLSGIYDYYSQYAAQPNRLLFHLHKKWPEQFAPLITRAGNRGRVGCGHDDCDFDLRGTDRGTLFCPACARPIRHRCGNAGCLADDLGGRWNLDQIIESKTCPSCKKFLRTYWWQCAEHGDVSMEKLACPECVREDRDPDGIARRPDAMQRFTCPNCAKRGVDRPFTARGSLARFLREGVNGHDESRARSEISAHLNDGRCPDCGTLLVPYCPTADRQQPDRRHFLYKHTADRFRCYTHTEKDFDTCDNCGYAVETDASRCLRCNTAIRVCRFCTAALGIRVTDVNGRCSHCTAALEVSLASPCGAVSKADHDDRFCSNLFGCPLGGRLNEVTLPSHVRPCPVCKERSLGLLLAETRKERVLDCPFCSRLFGFTPFHGSAFDCCKDAKQATHRNGETTTTDDDNTSPSEVSNKCCCLCGMSYLRSAELVKFAQVPAVANGHSKPDEAAAEATTLVDAFLAIANALRCYSDDGEAFRHLLQGYARLTHSRFEEYLYRFADSVERPETRAIVARRVTEIALLHRAQFDCGSPAHAEKRCGC